MSAEPLAEQQTAAPVTDHEPMCWRCERVLAEFVSRPWSLKCKRCKAQNRSPDCATRRDSVD